MTPKTLALACAVTLALPAAASAATCRLDMKIVNESGKTITIYQRADEKFDSRIMIKGGDWHRLWIKKEPGSTLALKPGQSHHWIYKAEQGCDAFRRIRFGATCGSGKTLNYFPGRSGWFERGKTSFRFKFGPASC